MSVSVRAHVHLMAFCKFNEFYSVCMFVPTTSVHVVDAVYSVRCCCCYFRMVDVHVNLSFALILSSRNVKSMNDMFSFCKELTAVQ